jgi:hypothetical protein
MSSDAPAVVVFVDLVARISIGHGVSRSMALEVLNSPFMLEGCGTSVECSQVAALAGARIGFARIQSILTG